MSRGFLRIKARAQGSFVCLCFSAASAVGGSAAACTHLRGLHFFVVYSLGSGACACMIWARSGGSFCVNI